MTLRRGRVKGESVIWLQTPTVIWLGGGTISPASECTLG
jgi:hypothetical protein